MEQLVYTYFKRNSDGHFVLKIGWDRLCYYWSYVPELHKWLQKQPDDKVCLLTEKNSKKDIVVRIIIHAKLVPRVKRVVAEAAEAYQRTRDE